MLKYILLANDKVRCNSISRSRLIRKQPIARQKLFLLLRQLRNERRKSWRRDGLTTLARRPWSSWWTSRPSVRNVGSLHQRDVPGANASGTADASARLRIGLGTRRLATPFLRPMKWLGSSCKFPVNLFFLGMWDRKVHEIHLACFFFSYSTFFFFYPKSLCEYNIRWNYKNMFWKSKVSSFRNAWLKLIFSFLKHLKHNYNS